MEGGKRRLRNSAISILTLSSFSHSSHESFPRDVAERGDAELSGTDIVTNGTERTVTVPLLSISLHSCRLSRARKRSSICSANSRPFSPDFDHG
jgi:hypothetical protein